MTARCQTFNSWFFARQFGLACLLIKCFCCRFLKCCKSSWKFILSTCSRGPKSCGVLSSLQKKQTKTKTRIINNTKNSLISDWMKIFDGMIRKDLDFNFNQTCCKGQSLKDIPTKIVCTFKCLFPTFFLPFISPSPSAPPPPPPHTHTHTHAMHTV